MELALHQINVNVMMDIKVIIKIMRIVVVLFVRMSVKMAIVFTQTNVSATKISKW